MQLGAFVEIQGGDRAERASLYGLPDELLSRYIAAEKTLVESLDLVNDIWEALEICKEGKARFPWAQMYRGAFKAFKEKWYTNRSVLRGFGLSKADLNRRLVQGEAWFRPYPFMPRQYLRRSEQLITVIQQAFSEISSGRCTLSTSTIADSTKSETFGVIASSNLEAKTKIFQEQTILVASSDNPLAVQESKSYSICELCCDIIPLQQMGVVKCGKCSAVYCNTSCRDGASTLYHEVLCGEDFGWLYEVNRSNNRREAKAVDKENAAEGAMWLRIIAICVQWGYHPLEHPLIARLTSQYKQDTTEWSLSGNIDRTQRILLQLGIDIFADVRYDTWVLQTIWSRIITNKLAVAGFGGRQIYIVGSFWCFFNHSCEPNVVLCQMETTTGNDVRASVSIACAARPITKGEELFISYIDQVGQSRNLRQRSLRGWLPEGCRCTKCGRGE